MYVILTINKVATAIKVTDMECAVCRLKLLTAADAKGARLLYLFHAVAYYCFKCCRNLGLQKPYQLKLIIT